MMDKIIVETETEMRDSELEPRTLNIPDGFADTTAAMACQAAHQCNASLIACFTASGKTAGLVAKYRPRAPVLAFCHAPKTQRYLALRWGVKSMALDPVDDAEKMVRLVDEQILKSKEVKTGEAIVVVYGAPVGEMGHTNAVRLHTVGSAY
jgi:pyruvate kinase